MTHTLKLIADVAILDASQQVLLVRYAETNSYDHQSGWFLPDDGLAEREHPDAAARRILTEQLGFDAGEPRLDHIESFAGNKGVWHMAFHYRVDLDVTPTLVPGSDVASAEWFRLDDLPPRAEVAHHGWALQVLRTMVGR